MASQERAVKKAVREAESLSTSQVHITWAIQCVIGILISVVGTLSITLLQNQNVEISAQTVRIEKFTSKVDELREEMLAFERGQLGDRFRLSDWNREKVELFKEISELRERVRNLEIAQ